MKKYDVCITEILDKHVIIEAEDREQAYEIAKEMYRNEEIVLDYNNLSQQEIEVLDEVNENEIR